MCVTNKAPWNEWVERGSNALADGGWAEARACFEQALACSDSAEAWDGLSWAWWWLEDGSTALPDCRQLTVGGDATPDSPGRA